MHGDRWSADEVAFTNDPFTPATAWTIARQVSAGDLSHADYLVAMDRSNASEMQYMARGAELDGRLLLLLDFAENTRLQDVPDPYYTGNFEEVFRLVESGCRGLLAHIRAEKGI